jgi:hypothetical protein
MAVTSMNCGFQIILSSGSIQSGQIGNAAVNSGNIASGQIGADHLASGLLGALSLTSGIVTSGYIGNAAVVSGSIGSGQIGGFHVQSGFIYPGSNVSITVDSNNNYQINATVSGGVAVNPLTFASGLALNSGSFFDGSVSMVAGIASGGILSNMLADGAIVSGKLSSGSVTTSALASGSVTLDILASGVQSSFSLASGSVQSGTIAPNAVTSGSIGSGAVTGFDIVSGLVYAGANIVVTLDGNNKYQVSATPSGSLSVLPLTVGSGLRLASGTFYDGSVPMAIGLSSGGVGSGTIANNAVVSGSIASGQITTDHFASGVLQSIVLSSGDVTSGFLGNASVVSGSVASGQLGYVHLNSGFVFNSDLLVSLNSGKTFGRYINGNVVPASGLSPLQVIELALNEPLYPTVNLSSPTTIQFFQTSINNVLNGSYSILVSGATVGSCDLSWRRNNTGAWTSLTTSTANPLNYSHTTVNIAGNIDPFNYRYTVIDSAGNTSVDYTNITPESYVAPTLNLSVLATSKVGPETNTKRETGNINTNLSGTIVRNSALVNLQTYTLQFLLSGAWTDIGVSTNISGSATYSIPATNQNDSALATASGTAYRIHYTDAYTSGNSTPVDVEFHNFIWYGPSSGAPTNSAEVRSLSGAIFVDGPNPFDMQTGNVDTNFSVAMPNTLTLQSVYDLTASNSDITGNFANNTFNVDNASAIATPYNIYTMTNAIPYASGHLLRITRV